jgi:nucleoid-associated protein YgaU
MHTVIAGDTLAALAKHYYGDPGRWPEIAARNQVTDPRLLRIGQRLTIP